MAAFSELGVMPDLCRILDDLQWQLPTDIQYEAIPLIMGGGDVLMASETGSGKTGAFCIPLVQVVHEHLANVKSDKQDIHSKKSTPINEWKLNVKDRAPELVLDSNHLKAQSKSGNWQGCRANKAIRKPRNRLPHKLYYEVHFEEQGLARVGWSFANSSFDLGTDKSGYGFGGTGKKSNNRQFSDYGQPFGEKFDIVGCILDLNSGELSFSKNGRYLGVAFKINSKQLETNELYPTICVKNAGCRVQFGATNAKNDFKPLDSIWLSDADESIVVNCNVCSKLDLANSPLAIIIEPTRELATQTYNCLESFSSDLDVRNILWTGGKDDDNSIDNKNPHIIVSTPGRLSSALRNNALDLKNIHFFILDEVDDLLNQGHQNLIKNLYSKLPKMFESGRRLQVICCSATLHKIEVQKLARELMYFPIWIDLKGEDSVPDTIHHVVFRVDPRIDHTYSDLVDLIQTDGVHENDNIHDTLEADPPMELKRPEELSEAVKLMKFYYTLKAIETLKMDRGIIFCRTKLDCDNLSNFMNDMCGKTNSDKYTNVRLHSSLGQSERDKNLKEFIMNKHRFLICTDVAARGIDVRGLPYVIQVTLSDEKTNYIHRIGRVGRTDKMGLAVSLVSNVPEKVWYHKCNKKHCNNTRLLEKGGCCTWIEELDILGDIEQHLKCSIQEIDSNFKLEVDEYDGKVVYGAKRLEHSLTYEGHVEQLKSIVNDLFELETKAQFDYLRLYM